MRECEYYVHNLDTRVIVCLDAFLYVCRHTNTHICIAYELYELKLKWNGYKILTHNDLVIVINLLSINCMYKPDIWCR